MPEILQVSQFKPDVKLAVKRGKDMSKLRGAILLLPWATLFRPARKTIR